jgi:hypothetical protein
VRVQARIYARFRSVPPNQAMQILTDAHWRKKRDASHWRSLALTLALGVPTVSKRWRETQVPQGSRSIVIVLPRRQSLSQRSSFTAHNLGSHSLRSNETHSDNFGDGIDVARERLASRRWVLLRSPPDRRGCQSCAAVIHIQKTSRPFRRLCWVACPKTTALYPRGAVLRALRTLASWPGTTRGTISSCDDYQHAQRRPCSENGMSGIRSVSTHHGRWACYLWTCCCLRRAIRKHGRDRDVD